MDDKKTYLVTGAAGHLGTALLRELGKDGAEVRALCIKGEKNLPENARIFYGNVCDRDSLNDFLAVEDPSNAILIHCAGIVSISSHFDQKVYDVNVGGTKNMTDECLSRGIGRMIYVSSVHAISERKDGGIMTEPESVDPDNVKGLYATTKAIATNYVLSASSRGLNASVVYPSGIIGPYDHGNSHTNTMVVDYLCHRLTSAVRGGYGFVDVRDVAKGIVSCAEKGQKGEGYIQIGRASCRERV